MENLGEICIPPCLWSNQYDNISESSSNYSITSSNIELNDPSFIPSSEIQRLINCEANSDLHGVGEEMMSILTPPFESINDSLDLDFSGQIESFFSFQVPAIFPQGEIIQNSKLSSENQCNAIDDRSKSDTKRVETSTAVDDTTSNNNNNNKRKYREERGFHITFETPSSGKKPKLEKKFKCSSLVDFREGNYEPDMEAIAQVKEMIYRAAALRPVNLGAEEAVEKPRRKNVRISSDPQTVAARHRRERISERLRVLQKLVPGGTKMDTASMLDEAANYLKFLKSQVSALETLGNNNKFDSMSNNSNFHSNPTLSFPIPLNQGFTMFHHPKP